MTVSINNELIDNLTRRANTCQDLTEKCRQIDFAFKVMLYVVSVIQSRESLRKYLIILNIWKEDQEVCH